MTCLALFFLRFSSIQTNFLDSIVKILVLAEDPTLRFATDFLYLANIVGSRNDFVFKNSIPIDHLHNEYELGPLVENILKQRSLVLEEELKLHFTLSWFSLPSISGALSGFINRGSYSEVWTIASCNHEGGRCQTTF